MFELINRRSSIGLRIGLIAASAAPPIALLLYLFVAQVSQGLQMTSQELAGAELIGEIWPALLPQADALGRTPPQPAPDDPRNIQFHTVAEAKAFVAAGPDQKITRGVALIRAVGDGSGLTLDSELATYYAMDAATVKLPRLLAAARAVSIATTPQDRAFAMGQLANFADATAYDLRRVMASDPTGSARKTLAQRAANLATVVARFRAAPRADLTLGAALDQAIDETWRANRAELVRMLRARDLRLETQLAVNLSLVSLSLCFAGMLMFTTARGMTGRLGGLLRTMDLLNAGDTSVTVPYLTDTSETGRIAATLEAFRQGLIEAVEERKRVTAANMALAEGEARYRLLADNASDVILGFDLDGILTYASPSVRQYGYESKELIGGGFADLVRPDDQDAVRQMFQDVKLGRPVTPQEWRVRAADGRWLSMEGGAAPILDETGVLVGVLAAMRDVGDRKAAEAALHEVNAELMRVARVSALGEFATSIAHEINQPLAAMVTNSDSAKQWLAKSPPNIAMAVEAMNRVGRDGRRASSIVGRMRALVTKQEAHDIEFDLDEAIAEVLMLTEHERHGLRVTAEVDHRDAGARIYGDRIQFQQVLLNLILNAIDAMRDVQPADRSLMIRTHTLGTGDIQVEVEDRGGGVDPAVADRIFDHLFTTKLGGTGLGLAISRSIIEGHGGRIWLEAAVPRGAIFKFTIPEVRRRVG